MLNNISREQHVSKDVNLKTFLQLESNTQQRIKEQEIFLYFINLLL